MRGQLAVEDDDEEEHDRVSFLDSCVRPKAVAFTTLFHDIVLVHNGRIIKPVAPDGASLQNWPFAAVSIVKIVWVGGERCALVPGPLPLNQWPILTSTLGDAAFVMQSCKTEVLFSACWLVLFIGEEARWTPRGLLSGGLWVAGGAGGCHAIPNCGMAILVGTWASIMVMINFLGGTFIFEEPVRSLEGVCGSFFYVGLGLVGMSRHSAPDVSNKADADAGTKPKAEQGSTEHESNACAETPDRLKPRKRHQDDAEEGEELATSTEENGRDCAHARSEDKPVIVCG